MQTRDDHGRLDHDLIINGAHRNLLVVRNDLGLLLGQRVHLHHVVRDAQVVQHGLDLAAVRAGFVLVQRHCRQRELLCRLGRSFHSGSREQSSGRAAHARHQHACSIRLYTGIISQRQQQLQLTVRSSSYLAREDRRHSHTSGLDSRALCQARSLRRRCAQRSAQTAENSSLHLLIPSSSRAASSARRHVNAPAPM